MCFLVRLRRKNCNFDAPGPSPVHFFRFRNIFQKIEISSFLDAFFHFGTTSRFRKPWTLSIWIGQGKCNLQWPNLAHDASKTSACPWNRKHEKVTRFWKWSSLARRASQETKMEESASHHVNVNDMCFLVRLRRRKCNFKAPGASPVHFFRFPDTF